MGVVMRGVIKGSVIKLPVTNRTAAAHLKGVLLRGRVDASTVLVCAAASESATGC